MKKIRKTYDILSIILICVWVVSLIIYQTMSVEALFEYSMKLMLVVGIISYLYVFSIISLLIFLASKKKEVSSMIVLILASLVLPFVIPVLAYFFVVRKLLKADSKK